MIHRKDKEYGRFSLHSSLDVLINELALGSWKYDPSTEESRRVTPAAANQ